MNNYKRIICRIYRELGIDIFTIQAVDHLPGVSSEVLACMANLGMIHQVGTIQPSGMPEYQIANHYIAICMCDIRSGEEIKA